MAQTEEEMKILEMFYKSKDLVVSATRHPKSISQVAENITVITAKEIEMMNAHTLGDVLNKVSGIYMTSSQDFGSPSLVAIQGSELWHVLFLLDGIPRNLMCHGVVATNLLPVGIIERIEVIKGPASSAWGSSLGGVVNIITKQPEDNQTPTGYVRASYGERSTQDYRAQISGKAGSVGYYLFADRQDSDILAGSRYIDSYNLYSKFKIPISKDVNMGLNIGYSEPRLGLGDFPSSDITSRGNFRSFFAKASLDASIAKGINFSLSFYSLRQKFIQMIDTFGLGTYGYLREPFIHSHYDEKTTGGNGKLVLEAGIHTTVLGADFNHGKLDQMLYAGQYLQSMGVQATSTTNPEIKKWAIYANDTIVINRWSITPGIRYDYDSITGSFISPSLGITYQLGKDSILRGSVARGFTTPPLSWTSGGALFLDPNPALEAEKVWSYQAGMESKTARYLWLKTSLFWHDLENAMIKEFYAAGETTFNDLYVNKGSIRRQGIEAEIETIPVYNLSFLAGLAYVRIKSSNQSDTTEKHTYNIGVRYDNKKSFNAHIFGHYIYEDKGDFYNANFDDFIWDLNLNKQIYSTEFAITEIFVSAHNIFNGSQYDTGDRKNPKRSVEAGIRINF
ncbi:MAG: TonB-dependent receptor [Desulfobacterales bacterium]|nr:TonB-dependent receptor [Desulfobacterales bacterium]